MTRPGRLTDTGRTSLDAILAASPELAVVTASVCAFIHLVTERRGRTLPEPWMAAALAADEPALRGLGH